MATLGSGNDNINIDGAETSFIDFGGNDTYTIIPSLSANVTITDNQASTINLPAGMDISAANFSANGVQFTVNGFTVTFIGNPSLFTFVFGGDPVFGGGTPKTFNETAVAFGTTVPAPGDAPNAATQTGPVDAGGTVGQALVLTASANSVDEGASVDVSLTNGMANTDYAYTITGVDAADISLPLTGTFTTDANGAFTGSIAAIADNLTEGTETMKVSIDGTNLSTDIAINDTSAAPGVFVLTPNTDAGPSFVGGAGDDTFNAPVIASGGVAGQPTLNPLDVIDGGAGTDTLLVETPQVVTGTVTNVENLTLIGPNVGGVGVNGDTSLNVSPFSGTVKLQQTNDLAVQFDGVAGQTIATDRVANGTIVDTNSTAAATSIGLKSEGPLGNTTFNVDGAALASVSLAVDGTLTGNAVTVVNSGVTNNNTVKNLSIDASGNSTVSFNGTALEAVTITGKGATTFTSTTAASKSIDASGSEGGAIIGTAMANGALFTGGAGKDTITLNATTKAHNMGAGDDTVNVNSLFGTGGSVDGGEGTGDTLAMSAALAETLSGATTFEGTVSNFEMVSLGQVASGANETVNLANLDDISMVKSAGTAGAVVTNAAVKEVQTLTIASAADANGGLLTVGGVDISIADAATTTQIRDAIVGQQAALLAANANLESVTANGANDVLFTYKNTAGDVANLTVAEKASGVTLGPVAESTKGTAGTGEVQTVTFDDGNAAANGTITLFGQASNIIIGETPTQVAAKVAATLTAAIAANNPAVANLATATSALGVLTLTYKNDLADNDVAQVAAPADYVNVFGAGTAPTIATATPGANGTQEVQTFTITSGAVAGGVLDIGGVNVTVAANATIDEIGTTIASNQAAIIAENNNIDNIAYNTGTNTVSVTYKVNTGDIAGNIIAAPNDDHSAGATPAVTETTKGELFVGTAAGILNLTNVGTGGTLELTGAINGASSVAVKDAATTAADTFTVALNGTSNIVNTAALTIANVETVNVTTSDTTTATDPTAASSLNLAATAATAVNVSGNHGVNFTGSTLGAVKTFDASGVTATGAAGSVTYTSTNTADDVTITGGAGNDSLISAAASTKVATINGGAGNDVITGGAGKDVLSGGDGNDVITGGANGDTLSGGAGNDIFDLNAIAESVLANRDVISDFSANTFGNGTAGAAGTGAVFASQANFTGDLIDVRGLAAGGASAVNVSVQANAADAQTFIQNQAGGANAIGASLDSSSGLLYMDFNNDGVIDSVIELTGVSTIDAAAFLVA